MDRPAPDDAALLAAAQAVRNHAHAPYSRFRVGAALRDDAGRVHVGCNVENASLGVTICAERAALAAAVAAGARRFEALALVCPTPEPAMPCGACRQALSEFAPDLRIVAATPEGATRETTLGALLPDQFRLDPDGPPAAP